MGDLIATIEIPNPITRIRTSNKRRAKYYRVGEKLPKKYRKCAHDKRGFLLNALGKRIVKNVRTVGTPKYEVLGGNKLSTGYASPFMRNKMVSEIKAFFRPFASQLPVFTRFPIRIEWDVYRFPNPSNWDLSNLWFYNKYFEDTLVDEGIIPDDSICYISQTAGPRLCPIAEDDIPRFVFRFYHDDRPEVSTNPLWSLSQAE